MYRPKTQKLRDLINRLPLQVEQACNIVYENQNAAHVSSIRTYQYCDSDICATSPARSAFCGPYCNRHIFSTLSPRTIIKSQRVSRSCGNISQHGNYQIYARIYRVDDLLYIMICLMCESFLCAPAGQSCSCDRWVESRPPSSSATRPALCSSAFHLYTPEGPRIANINSGGRVC